MTHFFQTPSREGDIDGREVNKSFQGAFSLLLVDVRPESLRIAGSREQRNKGS